MCFKIKAFSQGINLQARKRNSKDVDIQLLLENSKSMKKITMSVQGSFAHFV
jgi:hypothetical protein